MRGLASLLVTFTLTLAVVTPACAAEIWYEDNNLGRGGGRPADFVDKFRQPESFKEASGYIDVYLLRASVLQDMDDAFFTELLFPYLRTHNIKLAVNAGGATWLGAKPRRQEVLEKEIELFSRIKRLGGRVDYISMQSILSKPLRRQGKGSEVIDWPMDKRIAGAAIFASAARQVFPEAAIGVIDALPAHGGNYREAYRQLATALAKDNITLAYVHLDTNFRAPGIGQRGLSWQAIREVEDFVEQDLGTQFGIFAKSRRAGQTSSAAFHDAVLKVLDCYSGSGGTPRDYVVAAWFKHPERTIPENATGDDYPMMRIVLNFGRRFDQIQNGGGIAQASEPHWRERCGVIRN